MLKRPRGADYVGTHEFTTYASIFDARISGRWSIPEHIRLLCHHLTDAFENGIPERPKESRNGDVYEASDFVVRRLESHPKVQYAKQAKYGCWKEYQHQKVQQHLHNVDPTLLATEVPVWGEDWNGVADDLSVLPDSTVEVGDFKPDLPATIKKHPPGIVPLKTKAAIKIFSQIARYRAGFVERAAGVRAKFKAIVYDHEAAFELISDPLLK